MRTKAGMVHLVSRWTRGVQVKLWDPLRTRAIPERLRGVFTTRRYTNPLLPLPYLTFRLLYFVVAQSVWVCLRCNQEVECSTVGQTVLHSDIELIVNTRMPLSASMYVCLLHRDPMTRHRPTSTRWDTAWLRDCGSPPLNTMPSSGTSTTLVVIQCLLTNSHFYYFPWYFVGKW